jgi:hypothetical protein
MLRRGKHSNPAASAAVSALFGDKPTVDPLSTTDGCRQAAITLFFAIRERHDAAQAERIFRSLGAPSVPQRRKLRERMLLQFLELLHRVYGFDKQHQAARYIAELGRARRLRPQNPHAQCKTPKRRPKRRLFGASRQYVDRNYEGGYQPANRKIPRRSYL